MLQIQIFNHPKFYLKIESSDLRINWQQWLLSILFLQILTTNEEVKEIKFFSLNKERQTVISNIHQIIEKKLKHHMIEKSIVSKVELTRVIKIFSDL